MTVPYPDTSNGITLLIRTDFSDDGTWAEVAREAAKDRPIPGQEEWGPNNVFLNPGIRPISDRQFEGMTIDDLLDVAPDPPVPTDEQLRNPQGEPDVTPLHAYVADTMTMTHPDHPILAVNFFLERGENFRLTPAAVAGVECNLSIANLGFDDYIGSADPEGIVHE